MADALTLSVVQVLQYLRKRLSAEEMRAEHLKVVEGMVAAAAQRLKVTGRGLQATGTSATSFGGEEVVSDYKAPNQPDFYLVLGLVLQQKWLDAHGHGNQWARS